MLRKSKRIIVWLMTLAMIFSMSFTVMSSAIENSGGETDASAIKLSEAVEPAKLPTYTATESMTSLYDRVVKQSQKAPTSGYYSISTADELFLLASYVNDGRDGKGFTAEGLTFYLTSDIALGGESKPWVPIGQAYCPENGVALGDSNTHTFHGNFDGVGHKITGLYIGGTEYAGGSGKRNEANALFGLNYGNISNTAVYVTINTYRCGAGIAGHNYGTITACYSEGTIDANGGGGTRGTGGIAGENTGTVESCISKAQVYNQYRRAGGIVGYNVAGTVSNCIFKGFASSNNENYSGGIVASNTGTITNSYYLENSCKDNTMAWDVTTSAAAKIGEENTFNVNGKITDKEDTVYKLLSEKSGYFQAISDRAPVMYYQTAADDKAKFTITVEESELAKDPAAGAADMTAAEGAFEVYNGTERITGSVTLEEDTNLTIKVGAPPSDYWLRGISENGRTVITAGKDQIYNGMEYTYRVAKDATLSADYVSPDDVALKINAQVGTTGKTTTIGEVTWGSMLSSLAQNDTVGYMYKKDGGWKVVAVNQYVKISDILDELDISPADEDYILPVDTGGSSPNQPGCIPTYELIHDDEYYYYPEARNDDPYKINNKLQAPSCIALSWNSDSVRDDESVGEAVNRLTTDESDPNYAYFSGNLRFCTGTLESDFEGCASDDNYMSSDSYQGSITGNRLWSNVGSIVVRTPEENAVLTLNDEMLSILQLKAHKSVQKLKVSESGSETKKTYTGISLADLLENYGLSSVTAEASKGGSESLKINNKDHDWNNVMVAWSCIDSSYNELLSDGSLHFVIFDSESKVTKEIDVDTINTEKAAVAIDGQGYTLSELKKYESAKTFTRSSKKGTEEFTVTGISAKDMIENLSKNSAAAKVTFADDTGYTAVVSNSQYSWSDDVMLAWSIKDKDGNETLAEGTLRSAVNGSAGKLWANGVTNVTTEAGVLTYNGTSFTLEELQTYPTTQKMSMIKMGAATKYTVTGITMEDLELMYGKGRLLDTVNFAASDGFNSDVSSSEYSLDKMVAAWSIKDSSGSETLSEGSLRSAVDGGAGKLWVSSLATVTSSESTPEGYITKPFKINPTPADSTVEVREDDSKGALVSKSEDGTYHIILGKTYYYKVSKSSYSAKAGTFIPVYFDNDEDESTIAYSTPIDVSLNPSGSGSGSGSDSGSGRVDDENIMFSVNIQKGDDGTPTLVKEFSESELEAMLTTGVFPYLYAKNGWSAIVATEMVTLDDLFTEAGIKNHWKKGSYLKFNCTDGEYGKSYPTYENIQTMKYFFDADGQPTEVPAGMAITWNSGSIGQDYSDLTWDNINEFSKSAYRTKNCRLVFGITEKQYKMEDGYAPAGARSPSNVISMTLVYDGEAPEGTQGVEHKTDTTNPDAANPDTTNPDDTPYGETPFTDISTHWGKDAIQYVYKNNIMNGVSDVLFNPNGTLNRAMLATILYRDAGSPETNAQTVFTDVPEDSWYYKAVCWASANGIVNGTSADKFAPLNSITREQIAAMLYRYAKFKNCDVSASADLSSYTDSNQISAYAVEAMKWANAESFITGRTETTLAARGEATRAEMATIIERFNKRFEPGANEDAA